MLSVRPLPLLALALVACGTIPSQTTPDAGSAAPDPAYWGLADKECYRYEDGSASKLTVSVIVDTSTVGGVTTYKMLYRNNGFEQKTEWVAPGSKTLFLYRRHIPPNGSSSDQYITYAPAPNLLYEGLKSTDMGHVTTTTASTSSGGGNSTAMEQFTLNVESTDTVHANGADVQASQYLVTEAVTGGNSSTSKLWFAPQVGIVQMDQTGSARLWTLKTLDQNVAPNDCVP